MVQNYWRSYETSATSSRHAICTLEHRCEILKSHSNIPGRVPAFLEKHNVHIKFPYRQHEILSFCSVVYGIVAAMRDKTPLAVQRGN